MTANSPLSDPAAEPPQQSDAGSTAPAFSSSSGSRGFSEPAEVFQTADVGGAETQPISPVAIVSLGIGLLSLIAIFNPLWLIVGIAAILLGGATAISLSRRDAVRSGRNLAIAGCFLGCLATSWNLTSNITNRSHLYETASNFGLEWLDLIAEGRILEAREWMLPIYARVADDVDLETYFEVDAVAKDGLQMFTSNPDVQAVIDRGTECEWKVTKFEGMLPRGDGLEISLLIEDVSYKKPIEYTLRMMRTVVEDEDEVEYADWNITEFKRNRKVIQFNPNL